MVKHIDCDCLSVERRMRREAAAFNAVRGLKGCLTMHAQFSGVTDEDDGGASYFFAMPCAPDLCCAACFGVLPPP